MKNFREMTNEEIKEMGVKEINEVLDQMFIENEEGLKKWGLTGNVEERVRSFIENEKYGKKEKEEILISIFSMGAEIFIANESLTKIEIKGFAKMQRVDCEFGEAYYLLETSDGQYEISETTTFGLWGGWSVTEK